jgi:threonine dehydrogenase-like Zn-dependent dehydrogenase
VVAVDVSAKALAMARRFGATATIDATPLGAAPAGVAAGGPGSTAAAVRELTGGGVHLSLDALGSQTTVTASIESLRWHGRHVQVGWMPAVTGRPSVPMDLVMAGELEILGSHGMPAHAYQDLLPLVETGALRPAELITGELALPDAPAALAAMDRPGPAGIQVIVP